MLCKKHQVEGYNSSDCESCNLEIRIKQLEDENPQLKEIIHSCKAYRSFMIKSLVEKMDKIFTAEDMANSLNKYTEQKLK